MSKSEEKEKLEKMVSNFLESLSGCAVETAKDMLETFSKKELKERLIISSIIKLGAIYGTTITGTILQQAIDVLDGDEFDDEKMTNVAQNIITHMSNAIVICTIRAEAPIKIGEELQNAISPTDVAFTYDAIALEKGDFFALHTEDDITAIATKMMNDKDYAKGLVQLLDTTPLVELFKSKKTVLN